jgi:hypothetical protein
MFPLNFVAVGQFEFPKASRPLWFDVAQHREDGTLC